MKYEDVRQGPQAELDAALLKLLTVRTAPRVIRSKLESAKTNMPRDLKAFEVSMQRKKGNKCLCSSLARWPAPLWCTAESTGPVSRSGAAGAAPSPDAHFQHLGCIHPQSFWTSWEWTHKTEASYTSSHKHQCTVLDHCFPKSQECLWLGQILLTSLLSLCPTQQQLWHVVVHPVHMTWRPCVSDLRWDFRMIRNKHVASDFAPVFLDALATALGS